MRCATVTAAGLLLASPLVWWSWHREVMPPPQAAPSAVVTPVAMPPVALPSAEPVSAPPLVAAALAASAPRVAAPAPAPAPAASAPRDDGRIEVCGHGRVHPHELARLLPDEVHFETQGRLIAALLRGSERDPVVGLLLGIWLEADIAQSGPMRACGENVDCMIGLAPFRHAPPRQAVEALVQTALASSDPWTYATVASYACRYNTANACAALTPEGWQQRAPDDAAPWLWAAFLAQQRKDEAAVHAALDQASRRSRLSDPWGAILGPLMALPEMRALPPTARMQALIGPIGVMASLPGHVSVAGRHCSKLALQAQDRRERCEALAQLFVEQAPTMMYLGVGKGMGENLGWAPERIRLVGADIHGLQQTQLGSAALTPTGLFSCQGIADFERLFAEQGALGEVGALRKLRAARAAASAVPSK